MGSLLGGGNGGGQAAVAADRAASATDLDPSDRAASVARGSQEPPPCQQKDPGHDVSMHAPMRLIGCDEPDGP